MTAVRVVLDGCDDQTVFDLDLSDDELATVRMLAEKSGAASEYGCQPVLRVEVVW